MLRIVDFRVKVKIIIIIALLAMSIMSQNLIPVHIAFIPIVIPPLVSLFNDLRIDRRLIALVMDLVCVFLTCSYLMVSVKFSINHSKWFSKANHPIEMNMIWKAMLIPSMGYVVGLILDLCL